jgi:Xaa-Pro aminopeptidase
MDEVLDGAEHAPRVARLQRTLGERGLEGALLLHAVDVLYLTGTRQNAALWVPARGAPALLVRKSLARARRESAVADVRPFPPSRELAAALGARGAVGTPFDALPVATLEWWRRQLPGVEWADLSAPLREQRAVKSPAELAALREGGARLAAVLGEVPRLLRAGMTELELAAEVEARLRRAGNEGNTRLRAFNAEFSGGLAVAGESAAEPGMFDGPVVGRGLGPAYPVGASARPIGAGEPVLVDYTLVHGGYVVDATRTAVIGALAPHLARALDVAREIHDEVARLLRPGTPAVEPWERARAIAERAGLGDRFMGPPGDQARFVGHGVGLELDELPVLAAGAKGRLEAGNVVAVEPKFVFPGEGAVGVENTFAVTAAGGEKLTTLADDLLRA